MSVKAVAEKNFRRAQVKPGRRRRPRAWLNGRTARRSLAIMLAVYAGYRALGLVVSAGALHVTRIVVHGNVRLSSGEVEALVRELYGTNILAADLTRYRIRLLESPWLSDVALRRVFPSTIEIFVSERRPIGICRLGNQLYLVDRHGTLVDEFGPRYAEFDLPIVDGLVRAPRDGQPAIDESRTELAARVLDSLRASADLTRRVSQIDVSDAHDAVVLLDNDSALLHLGEDRFSERLRSYVQVASALRDHVPEIDYVDLRFDERVFVRPRGGGAAPPSRRTPARRKH